MSRVTLVLACLYGGGRPASVNEHASPGRLAPPRQVRQRAWHTLRIQIGQKGCVKARSWYWRASVHHSHIGSGPVHSAPAIAAARTAWRHPPPGIARGALPFQGIGKDRGERIRTKQRWG